MGDMYTMGWWKPSEGQEDDFVEAWEEFVKWGSELAGAGTARLARVTGDPERFVSFMDWESAEAAKEWKASDEFATRMAAVQEHVDEFKPLELEVVTAVSKGAVA